LSVTSKGTGCKDGTAPIVACTCPRLRPRIQDPDDEASRSFAARIPAPFAKTNTGVGAAFIIKAILAVDKGPSTPAVDLTPDVRCASAGRLQAAASRRREVGFATCELIAGAPRVACRVHGPTVIAVSWARHNTTFTAAFEDVVVHDEVVSNKQAATDRYGLSWRAVNHACIRLAEEALARTALLDGVVAVATDESEVRARSVTSRSCVTTSPARWRGLPQAAPRTPCERISPAGARL
jgi:hypothetical protein